MPAMLLRHLPMRFLSLALALLVLAIPAATQEGDSYTDFLRHAGELSEWGEYAQAIEAYDRALELEHTYEGYVGRGWARYYNDGTERQSLADFDRALELRPRDPLASAGRGYAHAFLGNAREAVRDLSTYLEADPSNAEAYMMRASALSLLGRESEASRDRARAVALDPRYADWADPSEQQAYLTLFLGLSILFVVWALAMGLAGLFLAGRDGERLLRVRGRGAGTAFIYDGSGKELFRIYLQNVVLTLLTFGVYRFWAKVRNRQFHYQHTSFARGRFDYHATGREKFVGFLKGMAILAPAIVGLFFLDGWAKRRFDAEFASNIVSWAFLLFMFALRPLVLVGSRRFNLARTSWNNLRLHFTGRVGDAYRLYGRDLLFLIGTFGFYWAWHACRVREFTMRHTRVGDARFAFHGKGRDFFGIQYLGVLLCYVTLGAYVPWYIAARHRFFMWNTRFEGKRLQSDLTGRAVLAIGGPAMLMAIFSFGLALPWAITRWRTLLAHSTFYRAEVDAERLVSIRDSAATSTLEGLGQAGEVLGDIGDLFGL